MTESFFKSPPQLNPVLSSDFLPVIETRFDSDHFHDGLFLSFDVDSPQLLKRAVNKRKAEFFAGRICAVSALDKLDVRKKIIAVGNDRQPIFPSGFYGTITHTDKHAMAAVVSSKFSSGIGIDREPIMTSDIAKDIEKQVLVAGDYPSIEKMAVLPDITFSCLVTLVYSAKESFYKAAYRQVNHFFDFDAVEINSIDWVAKRFQLKIRQSLSINLEKNQLIEGRFYQTENDKENDIVTMINLT